MPLTAAFFTQLKQPCATRGALYASLKQEQVDSLIAITAVFDAFTGHDHCIDDLAYIMATCYRECGPRLFLGVEELGKGRGKAYGVPAGKFNKIYYGRGPCQITWLNNYTQAEVVTKIPFTQFPELMCEPSKGIVYMIDAMYNGRFTKIGLRTYIQPGKPTTFAAFEQCRRIINGMDRAAEVAGYAMCFHAALSAGYTAPVTSQPTITQPSSPTQQRPTLLGAIRKWFGGK